MEECCDRIKGLGAKARDCLPGCSLPFTHKSRRKNPDENATPEQLAAHIGLIAPNGARKAKWDWFMLGLVLYTSISVPYQLAFYAFTDWENSEFGFVCDVIIDLLYMIDIFISWRTTYYDREGMLVLDRRMARRRYLKTWFGIDVFASFPFEYLFQLILIQSPIEVPPALRLPSLVKLLRIYRLGKKINRLSSSKMFRIGQFTSLLLMAAHWYACLWFYMGGLARPTGGVVDALPGVHGTSWVYRLDMENEGMTMQYASSLYWAVTTLMKSPWFHPNSPYEFIAATIMIIIGCVLFAYFLGNVTAVITAANAAGGRYRQQIEALQNFCRGEGISAKMTDKLLVYQDALWTETNSGTDIQAMIKGMPTHLLPYVLIGHIYRPLMDACPFLYDCSAWGCVEFLSALKVQVCEKGDTLIHQGTLIGVMYILVRGEVKIDAYTDPVKEIAEQYVMGGRIGGAKPKTLSKTKSAKDMMRGRTDKFGTLIGFHDVSKPTTPREYSVNATTRVSVLMITRPQLNTMFNLFPQDKHHVVRAIEAANAAHMNQALGAKGGGGGRRTAPPKNKAADGGGDSAGGELSEMSIRPPPAAPLPPATGGGGAETPPAPPSARSKSPTPVASATTGAPKEGAPKEGAPTAGDAPTAAAAAAAKGGSPPKDASPSTVRALDTTEPTPSHRAWLNGLVQAATPGQAAAPPIVPPSVIKDLSGEMEALRTELAEQRKMLEQILVNSRDKGLAA